MIHVKTHPRSMLRCWQPAARRDHGDWPNTAAFDVGHATDVAASTSEIDRRHRLRNSRSNHPRPVHGARRQERHQLSIARREDRCVRKSPRAHRRRTAAHTKHRGTSRRDRSDSGRDGDNRSWHHWQLAVAGSRCHECAARQWHVSDIALTRS